MNYVDRNETFVAEAKSIIKADYYNEPSEDKLSESLDYILVHPIKKLKVLANFNYQNKNDKKIGFITVGFTEINTDKQIIKREYNSENVIDFDIKPKHEMPIIGDVCWKVNEMIPAEKILSIRELSDYKHLTKEQIYFKLDNIRLRANQIGLENYIYEMNLEKKKTQDIIKKKTLTK